MGFSKSHMPKIVSNHELAIAKCEHDFLFHSFAIIVVFYNVKSFAAFEFCAKKVIPQNLLKVKFYGAFHKKFILCCGFDKKKSKQIPLKALFLALDVFNLIPMLFSYLTIFQCLILAIKRKGKIFQFY